MQHAQNLVAGKLIRGTKILTNKSPIDGTEVAKTELLSRKEVREIFLQASKIETGIAKTDFTELSRLATYIRKNKSVFFNQISKESGFIPKDVQDLIDGSVEFCKYYPLYLKQILCDDIYTSFSFKKGSRQRIRLTSLPYGLIAATTPRNTPLITELTVIVHALWSGNTLVLRPSPGVSGTVAILMKGIIECFNPDTLSRLFITFSDAKEFIDESLSQANLLHYVGSSKYLEGTLIAGIK